MLVEQLAPVIGVAQACAAVALPRATWYRHQQPKPAPKSPRRSHRRLDDAERARVLQVLHSERFVDAAPAQVYATLLDEGDYLCSERTMYRVLAEQGEGGERRNQRVHPPYEKPELLATRPNQLWSWDITKLKGPTTWTYFYLYVILDVYSRYVVGWMLAHRESAALATQLIEESINKQAINRDQLTLHADRGTSMRSKAVGHLLADLGVTKTHSRPYCSNDNPFSEAQFKTLKYRPGFPKRFGSFEDAKAFLRTFFQWYNESHRHSGIGLMTPSSVHHGEAMKIRAARQAVLDAARARHPERFVHGRPTPPKVPDAVWINPPGEES